VVELHPVWAAGHGGNADFVHLAAKRVVGPADGAADEVGGAGAGREVVTRLGAGGVARAAVVVHEHFAVLVQAPAATVRAIARGRQMRPVAGHTGDGAARGRADLVVRLSLVTRAGSARSAHAKVLAVALTAEPVGQVGGAVAGGHEPEEAALLRRG